jgi:lysophospholipase L1-like esterase
VRDATGIPVLVVNLPVTHEPVGQCYNVRYSARRVKQFNGWLQTECAARKFDYVDLHTLLPPDQFSDPLHPTAEGHRLIADELAPAVETLLRARAAGRRSSPR